MRVIKINRVFNYFMKKYIVFTMVFVLLAFIFSSAIVNASDVTRYNLTYTAGANGSITGATSQTIDSGSDGTAVTAVPDSGYTFVDWNDGSTANPRTDTNVLNDISVTANFTENPTVTPTSPATDCIPTNTPSITVTSPNGGEVYTVGQQITVKWNSCNVSGINSISLIQKNSGGGFSQVGIPEVFTGNQNSGSTVFTISSNIIPNNNYKISIWANVVNNFQAAGQSDNLFTINAPTPTSSITVTSPNGGEEWTEYNQITDTLSAHDASYNHDITWSGSPDYTDDTIVQAYLEKYTDGQYQTIGRIPPFSVGSIWWVTGLVSKTDCDLNYPSNLPNNCFNTSNMFIVPPGQYYVRLVDTQTNTWDRSDAPFTINPTIPVLDTTPRIMYWYGKVNQYTDSLGNWLSDPDGVSGAGNFAQWGKEGYGDRKLEYCQKWYPDTVSTEDYQLETITTWHDRGNVNNYTSTRMSTQCVQKTTPISTYVSTLPVDYTQVQSTSAMIRGQITNNGQENIDGIFNNGAKAWFEYGTDPTLITSTRFNQNSGINFEGFFNGFLTNILQPNTTYYYKACASGSVMDAKIFCGNIVSFTTSNSAPIGTCTPTSDPSITITSPNGGELFTAGQQIPVTWTSCNYTNQNISIRISLPNINNMGYGIGVFPNNGHAIITLPTPAVWLQTVSQNPPFPMPLGLYYKITVESQIAGNYFEDSSDNLFTINGSTLTNNFPDGCTSNSGWSLTTGAPCSSGTKLISYWSGKVNQHTEVSFNPTSIDVWVTDPDGISGANIDMLTYCKKWWPNTTSVIPFQNQTLTTWQDHGNVNDYTSTRMAYQCVQGTTPLYAPVNGSGSGGAVSQPNVIAPVVTPVVTSIPTAIPNTNIKPFFSSSVSFSHVLHYGQNGSEIKQLQQILAQKGYLPATAPNGHFGNQTKKAVIALQIAHKLNPIDGIVGPKTSVLLSNIQDIPSTTSTTVVPTPKQ